jgi:hypothetical protein
MKKKAPQRGLDHRAEASSNPFRKRLNLSQEAST